MQVFFKGFDYKCRKLHRKTAFYRTLVSTEHFLVAVSCFLGIFKNKLPCLATSVNYIFDLLLEKEQNHLKIDMTANSSMWFATRSKATEPLENTEFVKRVVQKVYERFLCFLLTIFIHELLTWIPTKGCLV